MNYSDQMLWEDMSRILYSRYYGALSDKQHGSGKISEQDFVQSKIKFGGEILSGLGYNSEFLKLIFTVDSLAAAPYGIGGQNVLTDKYGYDKKKIIKKIIKEINLSDMVEDAFKIIDTDSGQPTAVYTETRLLMIFNILPLEKMDFFPKQLAEELCNYFEKKECEIDKAIKEMLAPNADREERISGQEEDMRYVIEVLERDGVPGGGDPLMYLLGTKERDFAQRKRSDEIKSDSAEKSKLVPILDRMQYNYEAAESDFEYNNNSFYKGIVITRYIGNALNVQIPEKIDGIPVVSIGHAAFHKSNIKTCFIPDSVTDISYSTFYDCAGLTDVTLSDNIKKIGMYTFSGCSGLTHIKIPGSVTEIGDCAFKGCTGLSRITIPDSITKISSNAFEGCTALEGVSSIIERLKNLPSGISGVSTKVHDEETLKMADELLNIIVTDNMEIAFDEKTIANHAVNLYSLMIRGVEGVEQNNDSADPDGFDSWYSKRKTSLRIQRNDRYDFEFTAFDGYRYGGSERCDEERLFLKCLDSGKTYNLYESSCYMR